MTDLISEKEFQRTVLDLLHTLKYKTHHPFLSIASASGFPDIVATRGVDEDWPFSMGNEKPRYVWQYDRRDTRLVFLELKTERGQPTFEQWNWLRVLQAMGHEAFLIKPSDFDSIAEILR